MIEVAVRNILLADADVSDIVDDRVWFQIRPENQRQAGVVLSLVSSVPAFTFQGRAGYVNGRLQITALAPTYPQAKALAEACRDALDGYSGTNDATVIAYIETDNMRDVPAMPLAGAGLPATFGVNIDAKFMMKE